MTTATLLNSYRIVVAALLLLSSGLTIAGSEHHAMALATVEIAGTALFAWRRCQYAGAAILLSVFVFAEFVSIGPGHVPTYFLQYAAAVVFVVVMDRQLARHDEATEARV